MARQSVTAQIDFSGPLFTPDATGKLLDNIGKMMQAVADEEAAKARAALATGASGRELVRMTRDRVADHVVGRVTARPSKGGRNWKTAAVIQVYNEGLDAAQSRSLMAAASILERKLRVFRSLRSQTRNARPILAANLTAGLE